MRQKFNRMTAKEILDAANRYYRDEYIDLIHSYDAKGRPKKGEGDHISDWIVDQITDSVIEGKETGESDSEILEKAMKRIENGMADMDRALRGLGELFNRVYRAGK